MPTSHVKNNQGRPLKPKESLVPAWANQLLDQFEKAIAKNLLPVDCNLFHEWADGLYVREIYMKRGVFGVTKIHKKKHPFAVLEGKCIVWTAEKGFETITAPYHGITEPGTRRVLFNLEDTVWMTVHRTDIVPEVTCLSTEAVEEAVQVAVSKIEDEIIEKHENDLLTEEEKARFLHDIKGLTNS